MIKFVPFGKVERFEINIYEDMNSRTDTNDTVICRSFADNEDELNKMIENLTESYKGFKYTLTDNNKKKNKTKTGIL